jgi:hypothetical protein
MDAQVTIEALLETVFSMRSMPKLYKEDALTDWSSVVM